MNHEDELSTYEDGSWYWVRYETAFGESAMPAQYCAKRECFSTSIFARADVESVDVLGVLTQPVHIHANPPMWINMLAQEIHRLSGAQTLGSPELAAALAPFVQSLLSQSKWMDQLSQNRGALPRATIERLNPVPSGLPRYARQTG